MDKSFDTSSILIVDSIEDTLNELKSFLPSHDTRVIQNLESTKQEFLLPQANKAIKEAYISSNQTKYIILCGATFAKVAQNSLLKILEEPPKNIIFILLSNSKTSFLPTIFSRLQVKYLKKAKVIEPFSLDLKQLDLKLLYEYLKQNQKISANDAKMEIESLLFSIHKNKIVLGKKELELFSSSIKLLELNSRPINILTNLLLHLLHFIHLKKRKIR